MIKSKGIDVIVIMMSIVGVILSIIQLGQATTQECQKTAAYAIVSYSITMIFFMFHVLGPRISFAIQPCRIAASVATVGLLGITLALSADQSDLLVCMDRSSLIVHLVILACLIIRLLLIVIYFIFFSDPTPSRSEIVPLPRDPKRGLEEHEIALLLDSTSVDRHSLNPSNSLVCSICLQDYQNEDKIFALHNCKHRFHLNCISKWLLSKNECPCCRSVAVNLSLTRIVTVV